MIKTTGFSLIFSLYFQEFTKKTQKKSPIFSRTGGSHDQNGPNFTFFEIFNIWDYIRKKIEVIASFTQIL